MNCVQKYIGDMCSNSNYSTVCISPQSGGIAVSVVDSSGGCPFQYTVYLEVNIGGTWDVVASQLNNNGAAKHPGSQHWFPRSASGKYYRARVSVWATGWNIRTGSVKH